MKDLNHPEICMGILASHGRKTKMPNTEIGKADEITCRLMDISVIPYVPSLQVLELVEKMLNGELVIIQRCL